MICRSQSTSASSFTPSDAAAPAVPLDCPAQPGTLRAVPLDCPTVPPHSQQPLQGALLVHLVAAVLDVRVEGGARVPHHDVTDVIDENVVLVPCLQLLEEPAGSNPLLSFTCKWHLSLPTQAQLGADGSRTGLCQAEPSPPGADSGPGCSCPLAAQQQPGTATSTLPLPQPSSSTELVRPEFPEMGLEKK